MRAHECRVSASDVGRLIGTRIPTVHVLQLTQYRLWLTEQGEAFAEVDLEPGAKVVVRYSVHCAPAWAGIVTMLLHQLTDVVQVHTEAFVQKHDGAVVYGADAESYWSHCWKQLDILLTARFSGPPS